MVPRMMRVAERLREGEGLATLRLDGPGPAFSAGQFNMLYAFGVGESAISISSDPARPDGTEHTIRSVGAVTRALCALGPGDLVGVRGPFGSAWPMEAAEGRHLVMVAGGLGLAPMRPAIYVALARRARYAGLTLVVGARTPRALLYPYQLAGWSAGGALDLHLAVDSAGPDWTGEVGVVTRPLVRAVKQRDAAAVTALVCGPEIMMRHSARVLSELGVPEQEIWLSMERNMKCAVGHCGHCQFGPDFVCHDGPVLRYDRVAERLTIREL
jgi:NAD(P)H-flavin reductase